MKKFIVLLILILIIIPINARAIVDRFGVDLGKLRKFQAPTHPTVDVKPGDIIDNTNWQKIKNNAHPYILERVKNGTFKFRVKEKSSMIVPPEFNEATRKYAGTVKLGPDGELINYKAGIPFPKIDPDDPQAGLKVIWNFYWRWRGDDLILGTETGAVPGIRYVIDRHANEIKAKVGQYLLKSIGRVTLDPKPLLKGKENIEEYELWINYYPRDVSGTTVLWTRVTDPNKWDDMWIYLPSIRRIRRFPTSQRCSTRAPTDYTWDDSWGFQGKVTMHKYKLLGEGQIVSLFYTKNVPYKRNKGDILPIPMSEDFEVRDVWVVEQVSKDPNYCYGKRIYYFDKESWQVVYILLYDRKMELWKDLGLTMTYPWPSYKKKYGIDIYSVTGGFLMNYQTAHITITQIPELSYNIGLKPELFSLSTLQQIQRGGTISIK